MGQGFNISLWFLEEIFLVSFLSIYDRSKCPIMAMTLPTGSDTGHHMYFPKSLQEVLLKKIGLPLGDVLCMRKQGTYHDFSIRCQKKGVIMPCIPRHCTNAVVGFGFLPLPDVVTLLSGAGTFPSC